MKTTVAIALSFLLMGCGDSLVEVEPTEEETVHVEWVVDSSYDHTLVYAEVLSHGIVQEYRNVPLVSSIEVASGTPLKITGGSHTRFTEPQWISVKVFFDYEPLPSYIGGAYGQFVDLEFVAE